MVVFVGAALLLLRTGATERAEIPDTGSIAESIFSDDAVIPEPVVTVEPALMAVGRVVNDPPDVRAGRSFVSDIFRPPMALSLA